MPWRENEAEAVTTMIQMPGMPLSGLAGQNYYRNGKQESAQGRNLCPLADAGIMAGVGWRNLDALHILAAGVSRLDYSCDQTSQHRCAA